MLKHYGVLYKAQESPCCAHCLIEAMIIFLVIMSKVAGCIILAIPTVSRMRNFCQITPVIWQSPSCRCNPDLKLDPKPDWHKPDPEPDPKFRWQRRFPLWVCSRILPCGWPVWGYWTSEESVRIFRHTYWSPIHYYPFLLRGWSRRFNIVINIVVWL